jgi:hypothetical protein
MIRSKGDAVLELNSKIKLTMCKLRLVDREFVIHQMLSRWLTRVNLLIIHVLKFLIIRPERKRSCGISMFIGESIRR